MKLNGLRPMLESDNLEETIRFYTEVLGFRCNAVHPQTGKPVWANLARDEVAVMFTERNCHSPHATPTITGSLYFNTTAADALWEALKDNVTIEYPIENFIYGMREFGIRDCNGYLLQFGQEIRNTPPAE